ncbi:MAG: homoserine kinase [Micavibrio sp.]
MAVYTQITEVQLQDFLGHYDVGVLKRFSGIAQGVENTNYKIETDQGSFILTLYEKRVDQADLPFFFAFTAHLAAHGIECPETLRGRDGALTLPIAGKVAALITFLTGGDVKAAEITAEHCREVGLCLAQMHEAALSFQQNRENTLSLAGWIKLAGLTAEKADAVEPGLARLIADEILFLEQHWPASDDLPRAVIHADLFPDNVLFSGGKISGIIDFYFSCSDFLVYDLALVINAWCFDGDNQLNAGCLGELITAYQAERALQQSEKDFLSLMCRGAALRILLTRLYDWINHPAGALVQPKDPKEYSAKLRWHQHEKIGG